MLDEQTDDVSYELNSGIGGDPTAARSLSLHASLTRKKPTLYQRSTRTYLAQRECSQ